MSKIISIQSISDEEIVLPVVEDNHVRMSETIANVIKTQRTAPQKNLTPVPIHHSTRTNRVAFVIAPMWGPQIAPYGIARMAGLSRSQGFETKCWDVNIQCYNKVPQYWSYLVDWKWANEQLYFNEIHPGIVHILEKFLDELVSFNPTIIGFTAYYTNIKCTIWLLAQIRVRLPYAKIIVGGPEARYNINDDPPRSYNSPAVLFDHVVRGEGEMSFSKLLEDIENNVPHIKKYLDHDKAVKIDLDSLPIPDYRDFDIGSYQFKGIASEMSRGCVAKCTFCSETTFWRYRGRLSGSVLDEVEYNYKTFGIKTVWFIDSLINGNLKELLAFAQGLIDRNIKITWWGFCRNDGRMDRAYLKTLLDSGLGGLSVGVESGSQKVIDLIQKKVKVSEVEQNFKDLAELGSFNTGTSWFVGFPGEMITDFAQTLTLVWRLRNAGLQHKGFGICNLANDSPIGIYRDRFNIHKEYYGDKWRSTDWTNTIAHRAMRYKFVQVLLNHYRFHNVRKKFKGWRGEQQGFLPHYNLTYDVANWHDDIDFDLTFDYDIIKPNISPMADSLVNEVWGLLRVLWLAMGPFTFDIKFDPTLDHPIHGDFRYFPAGSGGIWADYKFNIDNAGNWSADFYTRLDVIDNHDHNHDHIQNFEYHWTGCGTWTRRTND